MPVIDFHPAASEEYLEAIRWYTEHSDVAGTRFKEAVQRYVLGIVEAPDRYPEYLYGTRKRKAGRYPYLIVYRLIKDEVQIVAIAHGRRRPGYWKSRLGG